MTNQTDDTGGGGLKRPLGPTGQIVQANVTRLRMVRRLGFTEMSERLNDIGKPITPMGLRRIENGARRVDADDLFALAVVLGVSPATLLIPNADDGAEEIVATGIPQGCTPEQLWKWLRIEESIDPDVERLEFWLVALAPWKRRELIKYVDAKFSSAGGLSGNLERPTDGDH
jgi:transcriptional regulator with XRE-family HTH domain